VSHFLLALFIVVVGAWAVWFYRRVASYYQDEDPPLLDGPRLAEQAKQVVDAADCICAQAAAGFADLHPITTDVAPAETDD
jgi:hypothetical protein